MSKSGYSDILAVLEYVDRKKKPHRFRRKEPEINIFNLLQAKKQEAKLLEEWLKEQEKINKKEGNDNSWLGKMTIVQRTVFFFLIGPPLGLGYMVLMLQMFKTAAIAVGVRT